METAEEPRPGPEVEQLEAGAGGEAGAELGEGLLVPAHTVPLEVQPGEYSALQCSTVQYSIVHYTTVQYLARPGEARRRSPSAATQPPVMLLPPRCSTRTLGLRMIPCSGDS